MCPRSRPTFVTYQFHIINSHDFVDVIRISAFYVDFIHFVIFDPSYLFVSILSNWSFVRSIVPVCVSQILGEIPSEGQPEQSLGPSRLREKDKHFGLKEMWSPKETVALYPSCHFLYLHSPSCRLIGYHQDISKSGGVTKLMAVKGGTTKPFSAQGEIRDCSDEIRLHDCPSLSFLSLVKIKLYYN